MYSYFAQFIPQNSGIFVYFPDIDVATQGEDMADAVFMAQDALRTHIEVCLEEGDSLALASDIQGVRAKAEAYCAELDIPMTEGTSYQFIQTDITEKPLRVNVTFSPRTLRAIDHAASSHGLSRSAFLTIAAQTYMQRNADRISQDIKIKGNPD